MKAAHHFPQLRRLCLFGNIWWPTACAAQTLLAAAQRLPQLRHLNMSDHSLCLHDVQALASAAPYLPHLRYLDLSDNHMTSEGAKVLAGAAPHLTQLEHLDPSNNRFGYRGLEPSQALSALAAAARHLQHLKYLIVACSEITLPQALMGTKQFCVWHQLVSTGTTAHIPGLEQLLWTRQTSSASPGGSCSTLAGVHPGLRQQGSWQAAAHTVVSSGGTDGTDS